MQQTIQKIRGFTLIELIITLSVVAILMLIATPSMQTMVVKNRMVTTLNELVADLNLARSEAIKRGQRTLLCKSSSGTQCDPNADWSDGWLLFHDSDGDRAVSANEQVIRVHAKLNKSIKLDYRGPSHRSHYVDFLASGETNNQNGRFWFCNLHDPDDNRALVISRTGRLRVEQRGSDANC